MNEFTMWEEKIVFLNGWFVYMDGKGNNSIISHERARMLELGYQRYQASMDVNRGGAEYEQAYPSRGFVLKGKEYIYEKFRVDQLIIGGVNPIPRVLKIPKKIKNIKINCIAREAFKDEAVIEEVIFHDDIHTIGEAAFAGCEKLRRINISDKHINIKNDAFKGTAIISSKVSYLNNVLVKVESNYEGVLKVKEGTLAIADEALLGCTEITQVDLPDGLISIGKASFKNCRGLRKIILPESVQTIDKFAFSDCSNLKAIKLPKTMKQIGWGTFANCVILEQINMPDGISEIGRMTFEKCKNLFEINIPKTVRKICFDAFKGSGLQIAYRDSCENELYIDNWLIHYKYDKVLTLVIKEGTIGIADMDWSQSKKIQSVELPNSLKYIGNYAFLGALIQSVNLPQGILRIGSAAFRGTALKEICIPDSVQEIEEWAFMDCENVENITVNGKNTNIIGAAITGRKDKRPIIIYAPQNSTANKYCLKYGQKDNLIFKSLETGFLKKIFKNQ